MGYCKQIKREVLERDYIYAICNGRGSKNNLSNLVYHSWRKCEILAYSLWVILIMLMWWYHRYGKHEIWAVTVKIESIVHIGGSEASSAYK